MIPTLCDAPNHLRGYVMCLLGIGLLVALAIAGGCDKSLGIDDVTWLCQSDEDCGSGYRCSGAGGAPKFTCLALASSDSDATGGGDVKPDVAASTRNCVNFCSVLDSLALCPGGGLTAGGLCEDACDGLSEGCFDCLESSDCDSLAACLDGSSCTVSDLACIGGGFCGGGFPFPGFP
jgi:hypothetical protein